MARVSSDEQAKGYSLGNQEKSLKEHCEKNGITILKCFREDHSAKTFNRPEWKDLIKFTKANKSQIDLLLVTDWSRFSRNTTDAYEQIRQFKKWGIEIQAIQQPIDMSIPENKAMLAFYLAIPEIENDRRSLKVKEGMNAAYSSGRYINKAPVGYKNGRDEDGKPIIIPDKNAKFIRYYFREMAKGKKLSIEIRETMRKRGFDLRRSNAGLVLRNHLYMGKVRVPPYKDQPSYLVDGIHEPIISEALFYKVQRRINKDHDKAVGKRRNLQKEAFPLRGFLYCSNCGKKVTGSTSKGGSGNKHHYYHCNHCKKERVKAQEINQALEDLLTVMKIDTDFEELYRAILKDVEQEDHSHKETSITTIKKQLDKCEKRLSRIKELLMDEKIEPEDFYEMKAPVQSKVDRLKEKIDSYSEDNKKVSKHDVKIAYDFSKKLARIYKEADVWLRQQLIRSTFSEKIFFSEKKCRTEKINYALAVILKADGRCRRNKKGQTHEKNGPVQYGGTYWSRTSDLLRVGQAL